MYHEEEQDKRSRNVGLIATVTVHGLLVLLLFLLMAWRAPDPPNPEYGVEINLGFSDEGTGNIQPQEEVGEEGSDEETNAQAEQVPQEQVQEENVQQQEEIVTDDSNPVSVNQEKNVVKEEVKTETKVQEVKVVPKEEKKVVDQSSLFTPKETSDNTASQKKGENLSQGNDKNATGDKGQPNGTLDPNASFKGLKGGGDNGDGTGLQLAGWQWDRRPNPKIPDNESGRLVFEIEVDENGEIIKLVTKERGLSAQAEKLYRDEILKLTLTRTGTNVPEISKGKITIVVRTQ